MSLAAGVCSRGLLVIIVESGGLFSFRVSPVYDGSFGSEGGSAVSSCGPDSAPVASPE